MENLTLFQTVKEKDGKIILGNLVPGQQVEIAANEIKRVRENFPEITVTLYGNRMIRISGKEMTPKVYSRFLELLRENMRVNQEVNKRQNRPNTC